MIPKEGNEDGVTYVTKKTLGERGILWKRLLEKVGIRFSKKLQH